MSFAPTSSVITPTGQTSRRDRVTTAVVVALIHVGLGYALLTGLDVPIPVRFATSLQLINLLPPPPPPAEKPAPTHPHHAHRNGAASPPNLRAKATEIVVPPPIVRLDIPPPVVAAPKIGIGADASAGAAPVVGPGSGSGGRGTGTGSGDAGDGDGDGGTPLELISGRLKDSDYPRSVPDGVGGTVSIRFIVGVQGRVTECAVTRSSGNADLDEVTCRLIKERLRYRPTLNAAGKPIPDVVIGTHRWTSRRGAADPNDDDEP
jgi:protein TonB